MSVWYNYRHLLTSDHRLLPEDAGYMEFRPGSQSSAYHTLIDASNCIELLPSKEYKFQGS